MMHEPRENSDERDNATGTQQSAAAQPSHADDLPEQPQILINAFIEAAKKLWIQIKHAASFVLVELGGYHAFDKVAQWCVRNPQIAICLLAGGLVMFLPFLLLLGLGISTIVMTFTGFVVLEGTLLTVVSMMLFGCIGALAIVMVLLAIVAVTAYFGFAHIYDLYGGVERHRTALMNFLQNEGTGRYYGSTRNPNIATLNSRNSSSNASTEFINDI